MASRRPIIGGNWKMNLNAAECAALTQALITGLKAPAAEVFICPAFVYLQQVGQLLRQANSPIKLASQDLYHQPNGAFTGEISLAMLKDVGVSVILAGHSERRHVIGENDELINAKVRASLAAGMDVVLCVGEKLQQREAGQTDAVNIGQTYAGLAGVSAAQMAKVVIAYEPVWAIGTGKTATKEDAQNAQAAIRKALGHMYGAAVADGVRIQYGGSVKASNAVELFSQPDIDGGLIGGASLKAEDFLPIVSAAG